MEDQNPDQAWLFDTGVGQTEEAGAVSQSIAIPAHERHKRGRKRLSAHLPVSMSFMTYRTRRRCVAESAHDIWGAGFHAI